MTLDELIGDYDRACVFGEEENPGNCDAVVESLDDAACDRVFRRDVAEIIAAANGENDGDEWIGVFLMKDGRYLIASGSCDYTGWD